MRAAMLSAEHSITIVGWDIDSRTTLVGCSGEADDGDPAELRPFLEALKRRKPHLQINLLLWDFASIYALEREALPRVKLAWEGANLVLDSCLPVGSSQHQKIVLIDGSLAFTGGLDVTIRRWDTAQHGFSNPHRVDPYGEPYNPFHDVQAVVDGRAAAALAELVAERWQCASGEELEQTQARDVWPECLQPLLRDVDIGISRTVPVQDGMNEAREVEQLFLDMIEAAQSTIYIENQFLTSVPVAECLARCLVAKPSLEALIITPKTHHSWLEAVAMRHGRIRFQAIVRNAGVGGRIRFVYPEVSEGRKTVDVMVHSKVMIVDDRLLRVGSANINNRSMGADSECDLTIEAATDDQRRQIGLARARLLAMHCGVSEIEATRVLRDHSLVEASKLLSGPHHRLVEIDDGATDMTDYPGVLDAVADPERPIDLDALISLTNGDASPGARLRAARSLAIAAILLLLLAGMWGIYSGDADAAVRGALLLSSGDEATPLVVIGVFLLGSALMVPVTVMIVAASATLGLPWGLAYAALGTLVSAASFYAIGSWLGTGIVRRVMGGRLAKVRNAIRRRGVVAIAAIRLVPIAPFSFVNLAAGAAGVGFWPFLGGTVLGMAPGFIILSALGDQLYRLIAEPTVASLVGAVALVLLWIAAVFFAQHWSRSQPAA